MSRRALAAIAALLALCACSGQILLTDGTDGATRDASGPATGDASVVDGGPDHDAALGPDAGATVDGGPALCGDTVCETGEDCLSCPDDCGPCPPQCDPPNTVEINGQCVPSCGYAGGNTCVAASSTLCDCLPHIDTYDCETCCNRPAYPQPGPSSHHIVVIADFTSWDAIYDLWTLGAGPMITSQNPPSQIPQDQWAMNIHHSWYATGEEMADAIHQTLCDPVAAPAKILIDELKTESLAKIAVAADRLRTLYPQWEGRWGAYLVNGASVAYPNLQPAIDALLGANAIVAAEMYVAQSQYCAAGNNAGQRDVWLGDFFHGTPTLGRFHWLAERRNVLGSSSHLTVLFGTTDFYLDGTAPAVFLDRMFYVWVTRSGYRSILLSANGGAGAYKWEFPDVSNTSRDLAFRESFQHYCIDGLTTSRLGQVSCP